MHRNLTGQIPIVIGTVPLNMNFINHPQPGSVSVNMSTYPNQSQIGWVANTDGNYNNFASEKVLTENISFRSTDLRRMSIWNKVYTRF